MNIARKLTANMAFAVGGRVLGAVMGLTTTALLTRHLGPDLFGVYRTALAWAVTTCVIANLGLSVVTLREISRPGADITRIVGTALSMRLGLGVFSVLLAAGIVLMLHSPGDIDPATLSRAILIAGVGCLATLGNEVVTTIFQSALAQARSSIAELAGGAVALALTALCVVIDGGLMLFIAAASSGLVATFLVSAVLARPIAPVRMCFDGTLARTLVVTGLPIFMSDIVGMVTLRLDTVMLSLLSLPAEVGYYGVANKLREVAIKLPYLFAAFLMPVLVQALHDRALFDQRLRDSLVSVWVFAVGLMLALGCFADTIVALIAGDGFAPSVNVVRITGIALGAGCLTAVLQYAALSREKATQVMRVHICAAIIALVGLFVLIPRFGASGAAWAVAAGETAFAIGLLPFASPNGLSALPWLRLLGVAVAGLLCVAIASALQAHQMPVYVTVPAVGGGYALFLLVTGMVKVEQIKLLLSRGSRRKNGEQPD